jgi:hypothetical protein
MPSSADLPPADHPAPQPESPQTQQVHHNVPPETPLEDPSDAGISVQRDAEAEPESEPEEEVGSDEIVQPTALQAADVPDPSLDLNMAKQRARDAYSAEARKDPDSYEALMRNFDAAMEGVEDLFALIQIRLPRPGSQLECSPLQFVPGVAVNALLHMSGEDAIRFGTLPFFTVGQITNVTVAEFMINNYCEGLDFAHVLDWFVQLIETNGTRCLLEFFPTQRPNAFPLGLETLTTWFATHGSKFDSQVTQKSRESALYLLGKVCADPQCGDLVCRSAEEILKHWPADDPDLPAVASMLLKCASDTGDDRLVGELLSISKGGISVLQHIFWRTADNPANGAMRELHELASKLPPATLLPLLVHDAESSEWESFVYGLLYSSAGSNTGEIPHGLLLALFDAIRGNSAYEGALSRDFPPENCASLVEFFKRDAYRCSAVKRLVVETPEEQFRSFLAAFGQHINPALAMSLLETRSNENAPLVFSLSTWGALGHEFLMLLLGKATDDGSDISIIKRLEKALLWKPSADAPNAFHNMALQIAQAADKDLALKALRLLTRLDKRTMLFVDHRDEFGSQAIIAALSGMLIGNSYGNSEMATALFEFLKERAKLWGDLNLWAQAPYDSQAQKFLPTYVFEVVLEHLPAEQKGELVEMFFAPRSNFAPLFVNILVWSHGHNAEYNFAFTFHKLLEDAPAARVTYLDKLQEILPRLDDEAIKAIHYGSDEGCGEWNNFVDQIKQSFPPVDA